MPSVPGKGGAMPKRTAERMGHRSKSEMESVDKVTIPGAVKAPPANEDWHDIAFNWYESLSESGQSIYFEPSDWAAAQLVAESMTGLLATGNGRISSQLFAAVWGAMNDLLTTEGSRRRLRLELERTGKDAAKNNQNAAVRAEYLQRIA